MSDSILHQLRHVERALSRRPLSSDQRRRFRPIIDLLCLRLGRSIGRSTQA